MLFSCPVCKCNIYGMDKQCEQLMGKSDINTCLVLYLIVRQLEQIFFKYLLLFIN